MARIGLHIAVNILFFLWMFLVRVEILGVKGAFKRGIPPYLIESGIIDRIFLCSRTFFGQSFFGIKKI